MCKTIKQVVRFQKSADEIYKSLTSPAHLQKITNQKANLKTKIGTAFSLFGGDVSGIIVDLSLNKRIVQAWRQKSFAPGIFSMAAIVLEKTHKGGTQLTLTHRGVPKNLIPQIEQQWRQKFWNKLK